MRVNYGQSVHGEEEIAAVVGVLRTSTQMGANVRAMEARVAGLFAKRHGIMVNSGSSANYLAVELLRLPPGSEVITPALTFATTVAPLVRNGLVPAFVDVREGAYNIDEDAIEAMITPRTRAMMIPSLIGNLPDWDRLRGHFGDQCAEIDCTFDAGGDAETLRAAIKRIRFEAEQAVRAGCTELFLTDEHIGESRVAIASVMWMPAQ